MMKNFLENLIEKFFWKEKNEKNFLFKFLEREFTEAIKRRVKIENQQQ